MRHVPARGQNLVLLALTLFLITLMVTMTLGIAARVRENHELQTLTDAAAYSNAVVTARAYNNIAIENRLQVSHWVAMAADQSLISYAGWAVASVAAAQNGAWQAETTGCGGNDPRAKQVRLDLNAEFLALRDLPTWTSLDDTAATEVLNIQGAIDGLRVETREGSSNDGVTWKLLDERAQQNVARELVRIANLPGVIPLADLSGNDPTRGPNGVSRREAGCARANDGMGSPINSSGTGLCSNSQWNINMLEAALGSRGNGWARNRGGTPPKIAAIFARVAANNTGANYSTTFTWGGHSGGGYFASSKDAAAADSVFAWGCDHGSVTTTIKVGGCTQTFTFATDGWVKSTDRADRSDEHDATPNLAGGAGPVIETVLPDLRHTLGTCIGGCPSVWVRAMTFQEGPGEPTNDIHGQPKNVVALQRDYADPKYQRPWELDFNFHFASAGPGTQFDNKGETLHKSSPGLNISKAIAWATGVSYYHRKGRWNEHPNLLNPFWRATLASVDVDRNTNAPTMASTDVTDLDLALNVAPGHAWQVESYKELVVKNGFKGLH
jgi:hypothetical protein